MISTQKDSVRTKRVVRFILIVFIAMLAVMMLLRVGLEITGQAILPVKKVQIFGNRFMSKREILALLNVHSGTSILFINLETAKQRLMGDNRVRVVQMVKVYPDTVKVHVREKDAAAILDLGHEKLLISADGTVLAKAEIDQSYSDYPYISLLSKHDDIKIGNPVDNLLVLNLLGAAIRFRGQYPDFASRMESFAVDDSGIWIVLRDPPYHVFLGNEVNLEKFNRLRALAYVLDQSRYEETDKEETVYIDMSGSHAAVREGDKDELR
jgi:hypothetical protein